MMLLLRAVARLIGAMLMIVIALIGLGVALYCLDALIKLGSVRPDRLIHLHAYSADVGRFLERLAAPGRTAWLAALGGLGAMVLGMIVLIGTLRSSSQHVVLLAEHSEDGRIAARPRVLGQIAGYLATRTEGVTNVSRPRVSTSRNGQRGRLTVRLTRTRTSDPDTVRAAAAEAMAPVS